MPGTAKPVEPAPSSKDVFDTLFPMFTALIEPEFDLHGGATPEEHERYHRSQESHFPFPLRPRIDPSHSWNSASGGEQRSVSYQ